MNVLTIRKCKLFFVYPRYKTNLSSIHHVLNIITPKNIGAIWKFKFTFITYCKICVKFYKWCHFLYQNWIILDMVPENIRNNVNL